MPRSATQNWCSVESLETRSLLTALVINPDTKAAFQNAAGGIEVDNTDMVGKSGSFDALVIEGFSISASSGDALSINLSGITLKRLAIESITVNQYSARGIDVALRNVLGLHTIAVEDVRVNGTSLGLDLTLRNTDADALTIDDSTIPGIRVDALAGSDIASGLITESTISAGAGVEGILLNVNRGTADNFHIENNPLITSVNQDFLRINSLNAPVDGLSIINNQVGTVTAGEGLLFRAVGDTFVQDMTLTNQSTQNEWIRTFVLDLSGIGLEFDEDPVTGKPFTASAADIAATGLTSSVVSANKQVLTLTFNDFSPTESIPFVIDIDRAGGRPAAIFGNDLIGADIRTRFQNFPRTTTRLVAGVMIGDPNSVTASQFATGPTVAGATQGIHLDLNNAPTTNLTIADNTVQGSPGNAVLIDATNFSDMTGVIQDNTLRGAGRDGLHFNMVDSNFAGAVLGNVIEANGGHGIAVLPSVSRSGIVEAVRDSNPVIVTSTNHGLVTGDEIMIQGLVNDDPTINHPGNGQYKITRIDNHIFRLDGVNGNVAGVDYVGGGTWYQPLFQPNGSARGLVTIDMQTAVPQGTIRAATNAAEIVITSPNHGLKSGDRVRISNVAGNTAANGVRKITRLSKNRFRLDGIAGNGAYDTSAGFGTWTANVITAATNNQNIVFTSPAHGLKTGDEIRVTGVLGNKNANGTFKVTVLDANKFRVYGVRGNGRYGGGGNWVRLNEKTTTGDLLPQRIGGNTINANRMAGLFVDVTTGTVFNGDIVGNSIQANAQTGIHLESHSFGLGTDLPLNPADPFALPGLQDVGFSVNIGTSAAGDGNTLDSNTRAGIQLEALDYGTARFRVVNNVISNSLNDNDPRTAGDGIAVELTNDLSTTEAISFFSESVIDGNFIGVDDGGNAGNGLSFKMGQRTRIQDLELTNTVFLNNALDGFHFERTEDADLNALVIEKNHSTNNGGDGFDLYARNTTKDVLDFNINENVIDDNAQYGVRVNLEADVRIDVEFDRNQVTGNGHTPNGEGYHPNDGVPGSTGAAGGVGILAFEEIGVQWSMADTVISRNIGDGLSIDAFNHDDILITHFDATKSKFNNNSLTGLRNHGTSFGSFDFVGSQFNANGEDGVRMVSIDDKNDSFYRRRAGMRDVDVTGLANKFNANVQNGVHLGQGVSASFGDGSIANSNYFNTNGEDGLKLTQHNSPHADRLGLRRLIQGNRNFFQNNVGDGIDIGQDAAQENGNLEHGDEVASDLNLVLNRAIITGNGGDGIEFLADTVLEVPRVTGGGQDVGFLGRSSLSVNNSRIVNNDGRGVDVLNRVTEDSYVYLINNDILSNGMEGVYVVNTVAHAQLQGDSSDVLEWTISPVGGQIELRVQDNLIESNGNSQSTSRVQIEQSAGNNDQTGVPANGSVNTAGEAVSDWIPATEQVQGTLGGLVVRVGTLDSIGTLLAARAGAELSLSGIDAEVWKNSFDGNFGADVYFDNFVSGIAPWTRSNFDNSDNPPFLWNVGYRDPLSRFDLSFRDNVGNSIHVLNGFSYQDNWESEFKSRSSGDSSAPDHGHAPLDEPGHWGDPGRKRNMTRTIGRYDDQMGVNPGSHAISPAGLWSYDGMGTSTWRVESDFEFTNFPQHESSSGYSDFFTVVNLDTENQRPYQWDTGVNAAPFTGATPYSLGRGDIFNVRAGQTPIRADQLDDNNGFVSAYDLGTISGLNSVNALTTNGNLNLNVKGDRDYYRFTAAATGNLDVNLSRLDASGSNLRYMIYEVTPTLRTEEIAMFQTLAGFPAYVTAAPLVSRTITAAVTAGREYIIEILSTENASVGAAFNGKPFVYGTTRSYSLSIDAPAAPGALPGAAPTGGGKAAGSSGAGATSGGKQSGSGSGSGSGASGASIPGERPTAAFVRVAPDPRSTAAGIITLNFSEDVTGVDINDFTFKRNTKTIPLPASVLRRVNTTRYTLNLSSLSGEGGKYTLTLVASGSGIRDSDNVALSANASDVWTVSNFLTNVSDTPDSDPGNGVGKDINGQRTLRAAVMESNASRGADVIRLGAKTFRLTRRGRYEDDALYGDLDVKGDLTIRGAGPAKTVINAFDIDRIFQVFVGATLTLENLTLRGGEAFDGGAIFNEGTVILKNVNVRLNEAYNQGGGIFNAAGAVLDVTGSSISQNLAGSRGGGVNNVGAASYVSTTISTNTAASRGGGIFNEGAATSSLINVTIAKNFAESRGAGLASEASRTSQLGNSILEANRTTARVPGVARGTINRDLLGGVQSLGFNLIQVLDRDFRTAASAGLLTSDQFGRDTKPLSPSLGNLRFDIGNHVGAHALRSGGLAVDGGSNPIYPNTPLLRQQDNVGNPRLIEGNGDGVVIIDVGAVELLVNTPVALFTANPNPAGLSEPVRFDGSSSTHPNPATGKIVKWEWDFDFNSQLGFNRDAMGETVTRSFTDAGRTSYIVRLQVTDNFGNTGFVDKVVQIGVPTKPTIQRPFSVTTDRTPVISWTADPAVYRLQLFNVTSGSRVGVLDVNNLTTTRYVPSSALPVGRYELIITSQNSSGPTPSDSYFFRIGASIAQTPAGTNFDLTPLFTWKPTNGSSRYELQVNQVSPTVINDVIRNAFISGSSFEAQTNLGLGTFKWRVRAFDGDGVGGAWSGFKTFTIGQIAMTRPLDVIVDTTPTFRWTDMDPKPPGQKDTRYELHVNQVGGPARIIYEPALTTTSFTPTTPLPNGTYDAWVRPLAPDGEAGLWSEVRTFVMDFRVGPVTYSPVGITTDTTPTFRWQAADGAVSYNLRVDKISTGDTGIIVVNVPHVANATEITYTPAAELLTGDYRWWVQTVSDSGSTSFSSPTDFTVPVPSIVNPRGPISTDSPLFTWNGVDEYVEYELWVDNTTSGTSAVLRVQGIRQKFYQTVLPFENGAFRAWVRGYDKDGNVSQWSGPADFDVTIGVGTAPILGFVSLNNNNVPTFRWTAGSNASTYEIIVKRISDASQPVVINQIGIQGLQFTASAPLSAGQYRWWVRGLDSTGNGLPWSQPREFFVSSNGQATPLSPSDLALADVAVPVVYTAQSEYWTGDAVRSISATQAGMVIQVDAEVTDAESVAAEMAVPEDVTEIDNFMEEWAAESLFAPAETAELFLPAVGAPAKTLDPVVTENTSKSTERGLHLLMAGVVAGAVVTSGKRNQDKK